MNHERARRMAAILALMISCLVAVLGQVAPVSAACNRGERLGAAALTNAFAPPGLGASGSAQGFGGGDYQRAFSLPDGRVLWMFQDIFFSNDNNLADPLNNAAHNAGLIQDGACFTIIGSQGADLVGRSLTTGSSRWFWTMDGEIGFDGNLWLFVVEMRNPSGTGATYGALPVRTWLAILDPFTLTQLYFEPAPDSGPDLYGWSVVSTDQYSYLYSHCYRQFAFDVAGPGQFDSNCTPHTYLARVPLGHFERQPEYWNGSGWSSDKNLASPILSRGVSNEMSVQWFGDTFVSVTKRDAWWGTVIHVDKAPTPQGPWTAAQADIPVVFDRKCATGCGNYAAQLLPWVDAEGKLTVALSNGAEFHLWLADGSLYRPSFYSIALPASPSSSPTTPSALPAARGDSGFVALTPSRVLDTRKAGTTRPQLAAGSIAQIDLRAIGMPSTATAVALNLTAVNATADGWVRAYPCEQGGLQTSNLNPVVGRVATNSATVAVGAGMICLLTAQPVDLVVDLNGWLTTDSTIGLLPSVATRLVDTRSGLGGALLQPGVQREVTVVGAGSTTTAVALNITAVAPRTGGFITVWPCGVTRPTASNLNPTPGVTAPNMVNVKVGTAGKVCLYSTARTDIVIDRLGEYRADAATRFASLTPLRVLDTRGDRNPRHQSMLPFIVAVGDVVAVQANLTAVHGRTPGFLSGYRCMDQLWPGTSNVNFDIQTASANSALVASGRGYSCVYASTEVELVFDVFGVWTR